MTTTVPRAPGELDPRAGRPSPSLVEQSIIGVGERSVIPEVGTGVWHGLASRPQLVHNRWYRPVAFGLTVFLLGLAFAWLIVAIGVAMGSGLGIDLGIMRVLGARWLGTGSMYTAAQLAGPYSAALTPELSATPGLYPPAVAPVFGLLSILPPPTAIALWWGVPLGLLAWFCLRCRPTPWAWAAIAACLAWPQTPWLIVSGSTSMLLAGAVAAGFIWRGPAVLVLLKPTLLPFALIGVRSRGWWVGAVVIGILTLLGPWRDYMTVLTNVTDGGGIAYSLGAVPLLLIPVIAWLGATSRTRRTSS